MLGTVFGLLDVFFCDVVPYNAGGSSFGGSGGVGGQAGGPGFGAAPAIDVQATNGCGYRTHQTVE